MLREDGLCQADFKLSMCYLGEPSQITVEPNPLIFYKDTETMITDGSEINTVQISPLVMNSISDPTAIQCEFTVVIES